jgi:hypothetical protein
MTDTYWLMQCKGFREHVGFEQKKAPSVWTYFSTFVHLQREDECIKDQSRKLPITILS